MIVAVTMVRDEADVIGPVLANLYAQGVDHIIAADNLSTDRTRSILEQHDRLTIIDDPEPGYYQATKMTRLARQAHDMGADWVLPFDADEVWYAEGGTIAQALDTVTADELDGLTISADDWWFNIRPSNTEPLLRLNVEAKDPARMAELRDELLARMRA